MKRIEMTYTGPTTGLSTNPKMTDADFKAAQASLALRSLASDMTFSAGSPPKSLQDQAYEAGIAMQNFSQIVRRMFLVWTFDRPKPASPEADRIAALEAKVEALSQEIFRISRGPTLVQPAIRAR